MISNLALYYVTMGVSTRVILFHSFTTESLDPFDELEFGRTDGRLFLIIGLCRFREELQKDPSKGLADSQTVF